MAIPTIPSSPLTSLRSPARLWFTRLLLATATFILTMIAARTLWDPVAAMQPMGIALTSPTAVTVARVGFGGFPLGMAVALLASLRSAERLFDGLYLLLGFMGAATLARLQGITIDGPTAYNLGLLLPEIFLCALTSVAIVLETRWRRSATRTAQRLSAE
jgi:hypothetical protein